MKFNFSEYKSHVFIKDEIPAISEIALGLDIDITSPSFKPIIIADENTAPIAAKMCDGRDLPYCILKSGEENKNWQSVQKILETANSANLGRDGIFIAVGGGVIGDMAGFASSIYKRGCRFVLVSTTLLGMVDASVGGKTGFDLFDIKNLVGSFYPAEAVFMPLETLSTLPEKELKSGMAELIKTAILAGDDFFNQLADNAEQNDILVSNSLCDYIEKAVAFKGAIASEDLRESENGRRRLLNLGHTFGHALESAAGLGNITHGEAVAWGIVRACELGLALQITPPVRAKKIKDLIASFGYECACPHPLIEDADVIFSAMQSDKKKKSGKLVFIVPDEKSARPVYLETKSDIQLLKNIIIGGN